MSTKYLLGSPKEMPKKAVESARLKVLQESRFKVHTYTIDETPVSNELTDVNQNNNSFPSFHVDTDKNVKKWTPSPLALDAQSSPESSSSPTQSQNGKKQTLSVSGRQDSPSSNKGSITSISHSISRMVSSTVKVVKRGRLFARRNKDRLVMKSGALNLESVHVNKKGAKYFQDMFTTILELRWRYVILVLIMAFLVTWIGFGLIWWGIGENKSGMFGTSKHDGNSSEPIPCVDGVDSFVSALLFSVESQHTIGYGTRAVTTECPLAVILVMLQSLIGVTISCVVTGLVFAKFGRPKNRYQTIIFSKVAAICEIEGVRKLVFRVGDLRKGHMVAVKIDAIMFNHGATDVEVPFYQHNLHVKSEAEDLFFLAWPILVTHTIDEHSPLWTMSEDDLISSDTEVVVIFEGTDPSSGQTTQARSSYLPSEIKWGSKMAPLMTKKKAGGQFQIDHSKFHETIEAEMCCWSAQEEMLNKRRKHNIKKTSPPPVIVFTNETSAL